MPLFVKLGAALGAAVLSLFAWLLAGDAGDTFLRRMGVAESPPAMFDGASAEAARLLTEAEAAVRAAPPEKQAKTLNEYADRLAAQGSDRNLALDTRFGVLNLATQSGDAVTSADAFRKLEAMDPPPLLFAEAIVAHARTLQTAGDAVHAVEVIKRLPRLGVRGLADEAAVVRSAYRSDIYAAAGDLDAARLSYLSEAPAEKDATTSEAYINHGLSLAVAQRERDFGLRVLVKAPAGVRPRHLSMMHVDAVAGDDAKLADAFADMLHAQFPQSAAAATQMLAMAKIVDTGARRERAATLYERILANPNAPAEVLKQAAAGLVRVRPPGGEATLVPRADPISRAPDEIERDPAKIGEDDL